ncbi:MAG: deoxyribonuclease IV [Deltaproteobacteria bacterium]|nr:deoxyribonuclease IV [Deltaproteobacteria bacterium]
MLLGAHESIAGGLHRAFALGEVDGCDAIQIFTKTSGQWREPVVDADRISAFRDARGQSRIARAPVLAHGSYLLNLCTRDAALIERSRVALVNEVLRCDALGVDQAIFHPGAHLGDGPRAGIERAVESLAWVVERTRGARTALVLENNAGQGSCVAAPFSELGAIIRGVDEVCGDESRARVGACIDTCHAFAAGYDLSTDEGWDAAFAELDRELGVARIRSMHLMK